MTTILLLLSLLSAPPADAPAPRTFDVRTYGATPDTPGDDDAVGINAAIAAAKAVGGGVVHVPRGRYDLNAPVAIADCTGVTLRGDGPSTVLGSGGYCGPLVAVGLPCASVPPDHRVPGLKTSVDTKGTHALAITGHPLQFGFTDRNSRPDYWGGSRPVTWDFAVSRPEGAVWNEWAPLLGFGNSWQQPAPWLVRWADGGLVLDLRFADDTFFHRLSIPVDPAAQVWRVSAQYDPATRRVAAWVNQKLVATSFAPGWGGGQSGELATHDGVTPFMVGYAGQGMDGVSFGGITPVVVHGFRVSRGLVYQWDGKNPGGQTFAVQPDLPVTDDTQFFTGIDQVIPDRSLIGYLPMDAEPAGSPWVSALTYRGRGVMAWLTPITELAVGTNLISIEDLTLAGAVQPTILLDRHSEVNVRRVISYGGSQAVGSMPQMTSYPLNLTDCDVAGWDSAVVSWNQMVSARNLTISRCGRNGIRTSGGTGLWDDVKVWRLSWYCESVFQHTGADDGLSQEYRHVLIDNEDYAPSVAFLNVEQGYVQRGLVKVDGFAVSALAPGSAMIRLAGKGASPPFAPYRIDARGLTSFGLSPVALRVDGPPAWHGPVDLSQTWPGAVVGDPASLSALSVTPPTGLYRPAPAAAP